ncbi:MAG: type II secretion system protein GspM [Gemmatimonadales bacterium]
MTARDKRALLIGAVVVAGAVIMLRGIPWAVSRYETLRSLTFERTAMLARAQDVLAGRDMVRDSLARVVTEIVGLAPQLVDGHTAAEAQASLQALVGLAARRHALKVVRFDPLPDSAVGAFNRVALSGELEGDIAGVARLLRSLESASPLLTVTTLGISAPEPAAQPNQPEVLRIELSVAGYYLPRSPPSEGDAR